jgi:hypothetical protein
VDVVANAFHVLLHAFEKLAIAREVRRIVAAIGLDHELLGKAFGDQSRLSVVWRFRWRWFQSSTAWASSDCVVFVQHEEQYRRADSGPSAFLTRID